MATAGLTTRAYSQSINTGIVDGKPAPGLSAEETELKLYKLSQTLLQDPENPELLLQKGIFLTQLGRSKAAFEVFESLRESFPDNPTPYANLASLYARSGKLEEARQMLIQADALQGNRLQTQLSLASVNIGLAMAALHKAHDINPNDLATKQKLKALEKYLIESDKKPGAGTTISTAELPSKQSSTLLMPAQDVSLPVEKPMRSRSASAARSTQDRLTLGAVELDSPSTQANPSTNDAKPITLANDHAQTKNSNTDGGKAGVINAVEAWGKAWTQRAYEEYAALYSSEFQPNDGLTREAWRARKKALFEKAQYIKVDLKVTQIQVDKTTATVKLSQHYKSDGYAETGQKELKLAIEQDRWKILSEKSLKK